MAAIVLCDVKYQCAWFCMGCKGLLESGGAKFGGGMERSGGEYMVGDEIKKLYMNWVFFYFC